MHTEKNDDTITEFTILQTTRRKKRTNIPATNDEKVSICLV